MANPTVENYWSEAACARAFWGQHELPPYRRLLADTMGWILPQSGEHWLDLGCGGGKLSHALWEKSGGKLGQIVGLDCAAENALAFQALRARACALGDEQRIRFLHSDFSAGLASLEKDRFHGVVSGLAIHYAESYSESEQCWTTAAYDHLLREVHRVLQPGGWFVFSVCIPEPAWGKVAFQSILGFFRARNPLSYIGNSLRMWKYGTWLKREARRGRFHYLPVNTVVRKLTDAGFHAIEHRLSFAGQAVVLRCRKNSGDINAEQTTAAAGASTVREELVPKSA